MRHDAKINWGALHPLWLLLLVIPAAFFGAMYFIDVQPPIAERYVITETQGILSESVRPPRRDDAWQAFPLAQFYSGKSPNSTSIWLRIALSEELRELEMEWMLLVPSPSNANLELWLDGRRYGQAGDSASSSSMIVTPTWFTVTNAPTDVPRHAYLRLVAALPQLYIAPVILGPRSELIGYAVYLDRVKHQLMLGITVLMLVLGTIMLAVHFLRSAKETLYGWYGLTLMIWACNLIIAQLESPPFLNAMFWRDVGPTSLGWFIFVAVAFMHRYVGDNRSRLERALFVWGFCCTAVILAYWLAGASSSSFKIWVWEPSLLLTGVYIVGNLTKAYLVSPVLDNKVLFVAAFFILCVGIRDYAFAHGLWGVQGNFLYFNLAAGIGLIPFSIMLVTRFAKALDTAEVLNEQLEDRVRQKTHELEEQHARTKGLEEERLLEGERQRVLREMHDGLGGHIVHAIAIAEQQPALEPFLSPLHLAMDDLRLIMDSLAPLEGNFEAAFASLRGRIAKTAQSLGMEFTWQMDQALLDIPLNPHQILTLARVVQEAVTNVVKHAHATQLSVLGHYESVSHTATISISDNGSGFTEQRTGGRGITNMQSRAAELDAALTIEHLKSGTKVSIRWTHSS